METSTQFAGTALETRPVLICLLGGFRLLKAGRPLEIRSGGKTEALISNLALHAKSPVPRSALLDSLWPDTDLDLAGQALDSLVHNLFRMLGDALDGARPVLHRYGCYQLNVEAGVGIDVAAFGRLVEEGEQHARGAEDALAISCYDRAIALYAGDLDAGTDLQALIERESLRACYLTVLARLADYHYEHRNYTVSLRHVLDLLRNDPCREDAHRMVMRCYVQLGERTQAFRQYRLCEAVLRREFGAEPEPATSALFEQMRLHPDEFESHDDGVQGHLTGWRWSMSRDTEKISLP